MTNIGRDLHAVSDLFTTLNKCLEDSFNYVCVPLVHPRQRREMSLAHVRDGPFTRSDMALTSSDWTSAVVGKISKWIDVDSPMDSIRKNSEAALEQELRWALHLGVPAIMIPVKKYESFNLASRLTPFVQSPTNVNFWMRLPLLAPGVDEDGAAGDVSTCGRGRRDSWEWWNVVRSMSRGSNRLAVVLDITADLPDEKALDRWMGEPVKAIVLPTSVFLTNKQGFPVLSRAHQALVKRFVALKSQVIVSGTPKHPQGDAVYIKYINFLIKSMGEKGEIESLLAGYEDYLEIPLQPLMDNLESQTYETFERDPVKYERYQKAVEKALVARVPESEKSSKVTVLMVVGAGRGPLVRASLAAAEAVGRKVRVFAVEKNPNAVVTLQTICEEEWGDRVTVVSSDMRVWRPPELADILVSELLGSIGDNELSPECLDGAQRLMKPDGISIPSRYTSYVAPITTNKLHNELLFHKKDKHLETPFVVLLKNHFRIAQPKALFVFDHPNKDCASVDGPDNTRFSRISFVAEESSTIHGFGGYFDSVLYDDVMISIHPDTHSPGMFSWFPMYIPLKEPVYVAKGQTVEACFWRKADSKKVWYEWALTSPAISAIHNSAGQCYSVGL